MGLYSSWASIVLISVFDWACISFSKGWGSIQEWASICADTVSLHVGPWAFLVVSWFQEIRVWLNYVKIEGFLKKTAAPLSVSLHHWKEWWIRTTHFWKRVFWWLKWLQRLKIPQFGQNWRLFKKENKFSTNNVWIHHCISRNNNFTECHCVLNLQIETKKRGKTWDIHFWTTHAYWC